MKHILLKEIPFNADPNKEYEDNLLSFLTLLPKGSKIEIVTITRNPKAFIDAIKKLIYEDWLRNGEYFFSNDYKYLQRQS